MSIWGRFRLGHFLEKRKIGEYMTKKVISFIIYGLLLIMVILFMYATIQRKIEKEIYTNICGYTFLEVLTGSMSGTIEIGDGVLVKLTTDVEKEDIIVYKKNNQLITHRFIQKEGEYLITKGDANNVQDEPITQYMVIGKVIGIIPNINMWKKILLGMVFILVILYCIVKQIFNKKNKDDTRRIDMVAACINAMARLPAFNEMYGDDDFSVRVL